MTLSNLKDQFSCLKPFNSHISGKRACINYDYEWESGYGL